jgi:cytochrome c biogenesis protein CcmG, thiol:disulfide interchange protein DsbE
MKIIISTVLAFFVFFQSEAQDGKRNLPNIDLKTTEGKTFNTGSIYNDGNPVVISFWATWCKPCVNELNTIQEVYEEWREATGVKIVAVSIDDTRNSAKVAPFVNGREWEYDILLDPNGDFKRAMNVNVIPHTFLINSKNEIIWQHNGYAPGDEKKLFEKIKELKLAEQSGDIIKKH